MASNLVLLSYKPGIQRDGTTFQGDMCSSGQWVRFQRGKIKKIGGMKSPNLPAYTNTLIASDISLFPYNGRIFYYIASSTRITCGEVDINFNDTENIYNNLNPVPNGANILWQSQTIINNGQRQIVFFGGNNAMDIAQNSASSIYYGNLFAEVNFTLLNNQQAGIDPLINGGMVYSNPYLFLYGSNGLVQYSRDNDPLNFSIPPLPAALPANPTVAQQTAYNEALDAHNNPTTGRVYISSDKVIYGHPIRAGANSPAILFWTLSSVVRLINVGDTNVDFRKDVISTSSSILSSKCVVEYDGLFFWPGTDRFFLYNGVVNEMVNPTNLNYFYDNIDMNFRQKVFGVKNTKYGEIWWFYPEKVGTPGRLPVNLIPAGTNTRALIYNVRENSWYDTAIYRDCGVFSNDLGILATYGMSITNPMANNNWLWRHEYGYTEDIERGANNGITSSITTPVFGWSSFNPVNSGTGSRAQPIDRWIELRRIEPDFLLNNVEFINVVVNTKMYAQSTLVSTDPFLFYYNTEKIDMRVQGREMSLTFSSDGYFEMGNVMMLLGIGDGQ